VKRYLFVGLSDLLLFIALSIASVWLISMAATVHWLLALILSMFCIVILGVVFWFAYKFFMLYKNYKYVRQKYTIVKNNTEVSKLDYVYLSNKLDEKIYKFTKGTRGDILYYLYRTKNENDPRPNILFARFETTENIIEKDNIVDQILLVHDVPIEENKTLIIVSLPKAKESIEQVIELNNPRNVLRNKFYCTYSEDSKIVSFGAYNELLSFESYNQMQSLVFSIFDIRETLNGESKE